MKIKKFFFAIFALICLGSNAWAQDWTGKGNTVSAGEYYLYNVYSGKYLTWGTNYGTRATLVQQAGELVTLTASGSAYKLTFSGITKSNKGLFLNGSNIPFCDGTAVDFTFTETSSGSKVYTISTNGRYLACRSDFSAEPSPLETVDNASQQATWMLIKRQDRIDALANATVDNPIDATFYINGAEINENFDNDGAWDGTDPTFGGRTGNLEATGLAAENYWGGNVESYQMLTGLPAGKYRVSCYGFYRDGSATEAGAKHDSGTESIKAYLFAGSNQTPLSSIMAGANNSSSDGGAEATTGKWVPDNMAQAVLFFFRGRYPTITVDAIVGDDGQLRVGIRKDTGTEQKWTIWDRFRLTYYGDDLTAYAEALEEAVNAANNFIATHVVPTAAENTISNVVTEKNKTYTTKADYIAATQAINDIVALYDTDELKDAYAAYKTMRTNVQGLENTSTYKYTDPGTAKSTFDDAISSANTAVEAATTASAIDTQTANIRAAAMTFISSVTAEDGNPFNLTFLASTAAADWQTASGLDPAATAPEWSVPKPDPSMADFVESYTQAKGGESITGNILYQTVSGMPAGYYTVALYAAASYTPNRGDLVEKCTDGQPNITFGFAGDNSLSLPVVHRTSLTAADQVPVNLSVQFASSGDLTFGIKKTEAGSNWHVAQIYTITYSKDPDLTVLKADRDALVSEAQGLLASDDANLLTTDQQNALSTAISTAEAANTFESLTEVTMTTLPNAIQTARQQIQTAKNGRESMLSALERFENDYNLADGTDYRKSTMSAAAWTDLLAAVNAVSTALDDVSQASSYGTLANALSSQMDATDASLRLFKSYKAMVEGTQALSITEGTTYAASGYMDTDATQQAAITALNTAFVNYNKTQTVNFGVSAFLGNNLDFSAAEGSALVTGENIEVYDIDGWEEAYSNVVAYTRLKTKDSDDNYNNKLYLRANWTDKAVIVKAFKEKMLPVGRYQLSLSWNSDMANMTNLSQFKVGETTTAIGENGNETLTYEFTVTDAATPFDLVIGFQKTGSGNTPAQIIVDDVTLTALVNNITLYDDGSHDPTNATTIAANDNSMANVTISGRTLYKDDDWNTLCLPFDVEDISTSPLAGATIKELDTEGTYDTDKKTGYDSGTLYLYFKDATAIIAGKPYLIKWASGTDIEKPVFKGVTVRNVTNNSTSEDGKLSFVGTYDPALLQKGTWANFYLGDGNNLYYPEDDNFYVNAFRAYFTLVLGTSGSSNVRDIIMNLDETTGIILSEERRVKSEESGDGVWYDLSGRKLSGKPKTKGLYIFNGKTVLIDN